MKVQLSDIGEKGIEVSFELDKDQLNGLIMDPQEEYRGAGQGLKVHLRLDRADDVILVKGRFVAEVGYDCSRCAAELSSHLDAPLEAVLMPAPVAARGGDEEEIELVAEDLDVTFYEGVEVDLHQIVREAIFLEVPSYPSCGIEPQEDCERWQANIGQSVREMEAQRHDLRWDALATIKAKMVNGQSSED